MRLEFSAYAEANLEEITDWIAQDNPRRAVSFAAELRDACEGLLSYPSAFPVVAGFPDVRRRLHGAYLIFYRLRDDTLLILAILHGATDYESTLADLV